MINPDMFVMSNGAPTTVAKTLAFSIISWFRGDPDEAAKDEELEQAKADIAKGVETLLAMVWVAENLGLTPVILEDLRERRSGSQPDYQKCHEKTCREGLYTRRRRHGWWKHGPSTGSSSVCIVVPEHCDRSQ